MWPLGTASRRRTRAASPTTTWPPNRPDHKHEDAEEVYVVLSGSGRVKLDDEIVEISKLDAIRVAPGVTRAFESGPDGVEFLAFVPHHEGNGEIIQNRWAD